MLINLTNHPYNDWSEVQREAAREWGEVKDMAFPKIDALADELNIDALSNTYLAKIEEIAAMEHVTVHVMGEMTFTFSLVMKLQRAGIQCIASTSERNVVEIETDVKQVNFGFVRFRKY